MPKGVYKKTKEHIELLRKLALGRKRSKESIQKGIDTRHNNGKPWHSEERNRNHSKAITGRILTPKEVEAYKLKGLKKRGKTLEELGHDSDCQCCFCKCNRSEIKGENHPSFLTDEEILKAPWEQRYYMVHLRIKEKYGSANRCENKDCCKKSEKF